MKTVFITGADGFLGRKLTDIFLESGWQVLGGVRTLKNNSRLRNDVKYSEFEIGKSDFDLNLSGEDITIVHCAWKMDGTESEIEMANLNSIKKITTASKNFDAHLIFISSMAAHPKALSAYGKTKYASENIVSSWNRHTIIRPGTIVGNGGLFKKTIDLLKKIPLIPLFYGGKQKIQLIGLNQLCQAVLFSANQNVLGSYSIACFPGIEMDTMYKSISNLLGLNRFFLKIPSDFFFIRLNFFRIIWTKTADY